MPPFLYIYIYITTQQATKQQPTPSIHLCVQANRKPAFRTIQQRKPTHTWSTVERWSERERERERERCRFRVFCRTNAM